MLHTVLLIFFLFVASPESPLLEKTSSASKDEVEGSSYEDSDLDPDEATSAPVPRERHGDHWDQVISYESPWRDWDDPGQGGWMERFCEHGDKSVANDELARRALTRTWLQKLSGLRRRDLPALEDPYLGGGRPGRPAVPLFAGGGDEYQIKLHLGNFLTGVRCPAADGDDDEVQWIDSADPLVRIRYRLPRPEGAPPPSEPPLPRFGIPLGNLAVRTRSRYPAHWLGEEPLTERTDYGVMLDPESDAMPLWLLCSRRRLQERVEENGCDVPQLPIFEGLMQNEDYGYDAACILDSVHRIGMEGPDRPTFEEACELVRKTRAVVDPGSLYASKAMLEEIVGEALPEDFNERVKSRRSYFPKTKGT